MNGRSKLPELNAWCKAWLEQNGIKMSKQGQNRCFEGNTPLYVSVDACLSRVAAGTQAPFYHAHHVSGGYADWLFRPGVAWEHSQIHTMTRALGHSGVLAGLDLSIDNSGHQLALSSVSNRSWFNLYK